MFIEILNSRDFLIGIAVFNLILFIAFIINTIKIKKINKMYISFMKKVGNGNNIDEMLKQYVSKVEKMEEVNEEIIRYCKQINKDISKCIQKTGIVRYNAFKDTGSDLSFALTLLDENNDGYILNGIYSREMSNIYAKKVSQGQPQSKISLEEQQSLDIAIKNEKDYKFNTNGKIK